MATARANEKALGYIAQLEQARLAAQWEQIPELTRKVLKHAPGRRCLVLTAQTESQVATYEPSKAPSRPGTAASATSISSSTLAKLIAPLLKAIDEETTHAEDAFQATVCVGWIHWVLHEPQLAIVRLPKDIMGDLTRLTSEAGFQSKGWVSVCALKAAYIKGFSLEKTAGPVEGLEVYTSLLPFFTSQTQPLGSYSPELRLWAERLLSRMTAAGMKSKPLGDWMDLEDMLRMFHSWISLFKTSPANAKEAGAAARVPPSMIELGAEVDYSRWDVWMAYYDTLSEILLRGYIYAPSYSDKKPELLYTAEGLSESEYLACRLKQRAELKQVEASIETKLLEETRFPKATERNSRVERWVDAIMANWHILCGSTWTDAELGEGGKNAIARGVLDILYRAATKSFHSTQILRYLFTVHAYVTEFDLAFKAFDTYVELVQKGKDREDKTGAPDYSLDNDDTTLHTVSEAIRILCRFGDRREVEKAREVAGTLQKWLDRATAEAEAQESADHTTQVPVRIPVSPQAVAEAYTALGVAEASWARLTYDASARNGLQQKAVELFRTSLKVSFGTEPDLSTSYQLALVLAEMRELNAAIKVVKQAMSRPARGGDFLSPVRTNGSLSSSSQQRTSNETTDYSKERKLIPFWHLLTLLLTAKADLATAARTSNAAFEQFEDHQVLFGPEPQFKSEHLQDLEKGGGGAESAIAMPRGLVDRMERHEKEGIVQVKLTQIAIKEELQGAAEAVESSAELLALYSRLFGDPRGGGRANERLETGKPPKTGLSSRLSVFSRIGRSKSRAGRPASVTPSVPSLPGTERGTRRTSIAGTVTTTAPTIQVTNEDGTASSRHERHAHGLGRSKSQHSVGRAGSQQEPRRSTSHGRLQKRTPSQSRKSVESSRPPSTHTQNGTASSVDYAATSTPSPMPPRGESRISNFSLPRPSTASEVSSPGPAQPLREIPHNLDRISEPPPSGHRDQPPRQDIRLPAPHPSTGHVSPEPLFPVVQERRQKMALLVELWLFIAGLYTRASLFEDAKAAVEEAVEAVSSIETTLAAETSSAKAFAARGWGGGKSVEELWGDVHAARGDLEHARGEMYDAIASYERALSHAPDHPAATVGLTNLLLDISSGALPPEAPEPPLYPGAAPAPFKPHDPPPTNTPSCTPEELNRLAARDRAYGLLQGVTKLGTGWDYSEAWYGLARCYEMGGQVEKSKEVLWWVVELEDTRPVRGWGSVKGV